MDKTAKKERFEAVFTGPILNELLAAMTAQGMPKEVIAWHKDVRLSASSWEYL